MLLWAFSNVNVKEYSMDIAMHICIITSRAQKLAGSCLLLMQCKNMALYV